MSLIADLSQIADTGLPQCSESTWTNSASTNPQFIPVNQPGPGTCQPARAWTTHHTIGVFSCYDAWHVVRAQIKFVQWLIIPGVLITKDTGVKCPFIPRKLDRRARGVTFCCDGREKAFVNRDRDTKHMAFVKTKCTPAGK